MRPNKLLKSILAAVIFCSAGTVNAANDVTAKPIELSMSVSQLQALADIGDQHAQFELALAYSSGTETTRDDEQAIYWYEQAAEQGMVEAQYSLALMLQYGQGRPADKAKAATLHTKAAKQGHVAAQYALGMMYFHGQGVSEDPIKAWTWLALAADNGYRSAILVRDAAKLGLSDSAIILAQQTYTELKNRLPEPHQSTLMVLAAADN